MLVRSFKEIQKPLIVAEISGNHCGDLDLALETVRAAAVAGADAVKVQSFTADSMTLRVEDPHFKANPDSAWAGEYLYDLYARSALPFEWHEILAREAKRHGIIFFSSPFDESAVDFLDDLGVPFFKIASFECIDLPLIRHAAGKGKPLIISTGMATEEEVCLAFEEAISAGLDKTQVMLLKCTSNYPATFDDANLSAMASLNVRFDCPVGLSDHTLGLRCAEVALALGAKLVEKHFVLSSSKEQAVDGHFSATETELAELVCSRDQIHSILGRPDIGPTLSESSSRQRRRSIFVTQTIESGDVLTAQNMKRLRPGHGLDPKFYYEVLGRRVNRDLPVGHPLKFDDLI